MTTLRPLEAENAVIGSILISPECLPVAAGILSPGDFGLEANRQLFQAALALTRAGKPADPVLLGQEVRRMGGSVSNEYIMQLMDATPTAANVEEYARLTRENAVARGIRDLAGRCLERLDQQARPQDILEETARTLEQLEQQGTERELIGPQEGMLRFYQHRETVERGEGKGFVPTGYRDLDNVLGGGMLASGMYVLAARPGMGKTTLALNIADRVAKRTGPVLFISLEMDVEQLEAKRAARESGVPGNKLLMQRLTDAEYTKVAQAADVLNELPLYVNQKASATVAEMETLARKVPGLALIVIDYLGKVSPGEQGRLSSRYDYTTEISGAIKTLARRFRVPVLTLAQLNRESEARQDHRPQLSDLRDTGAIEQDADGVIFLLRPEYYEGPGDRDPYAPEELNVLVAKNRHGPTGECQMAFYPGTSRVLPLSNDPRKAYRSSEAFKQARAEDREQARDRGGRDQS